MEFALPIRHQVGLLDVVDREAVRPAITSDLHAAVLRRLEGSVEIATPLYPVVEPNTGALTHESRKIPLSPQGPIKPGRAHFKLIRVRDRISHIEGGRNVPTHSFAIVQSNLSELLSRGHRPRARARRGVDEEAHHPARRLAPALDFDQIEAGVANIGLSEQSQVLNVLSHAGFGV